MKLLYISCHEILEYDELKIFADLGIDCFSMGAYHDPKGHSSLKRPPLTQLNYYGEYDRLYTSRPRTEIHPDLLKDFDVIMVMGGSGDVEILTENWPNIKHKKVIWRTIGQSYPWQERSLRPLREDGLKIVRYSPKEKNLPDYLGHDAIIRFYKDEDEYGGWNGGNLQVINVTQSLKARRFNCFYDLINEVGSGFPLKIFGPGNDNLGNLNGGQLDYEGLKGQLRDGRVYFYTGTWPASYTLSFIEAFMTGIPIVSISKRLFGSHFRSELDVDLYEVPELISHGQTGFIADTPEEARSYIKNLLDNGELAAKFSEKARRKAIDVFGKIKIKNQWKELLL
jgi:hypothetical protein